MDDDRRLVYSTDGGWAKRTPLPPNDGVVRVSRERRRASSITVVTGVPTAQLESLGKELKRLCGAGGTVKDGRIEIQGDQRDRIAAHLEGLGMRVKRAGG
ncbi:stress response translation initiation inhibitor YciH [bacterium]|nr:MAG: stress response translation initiation inhibitor YciH [bacterium]